MNGENRVCDCLAGVCGPDSDLHSVCFLLSGSQQASRAKHAQCITIQTLGKIILSIGSILMQLLMCHKIQLREGIGVIVTKVLSESGMD